MTSKRNAELQLLAGWAGNWRERPQAESDNIGTMDEEAVCLLHWLSHFPFIVYAGYCVWRKLLIMLPKTATELQPPLWKSKNTRHLVNPEGLGVTGRIAGVAQLFTKDFLLQIPVPRISISGNFGTLFNTLIKCNQLDAVYHLASRLPLDFEWNSESPGPLHVALKADNHQMISVLVRSGASGATISGELHDLCSAGKTEMVAALLGGAGVDVNKSQFLSKNTPLHEAVRADRKHIVKILIEQGANIDAQNRWLHTPLHIAVTCRHAALVSQLLTAGADISLLDEKGNSATDKAMGSEEIMGLLFADVPRVPP